MGQKVHPNGIRLGITKEWNSRWYANSQNFADFVVGDFEVRNFLKKKLMANGVSKIHIDRLANGMRVTLHAARPGNIIGRKGEDIEALRKEVTALAGVPVSINLEEIRKPELDAQLVGESITQQLEKRVQFRRAMKRAVTNAMRAGAKGIKIMVSGRLNGAEIARSEWYREGRVPLHTFRADVDYGFAEALTTYGIIGVKVWIFKGEMLGKLALVERQAEAPKQRRHRANAAK
ncbi:MAG: 30S ribosomal protein S3 [Gammaproteobacteria bacterium]|nr:30S ribosomal protein S3 [Gammaproteobacteria bacterium]